MSQEHLGVRISQIFQKISTLKTANDQEKSHKI